MSKTAADKKTDLELLQEAQSTITRLEGEAATAQQTISNLEANLEAANLKIEGFVSQVEKLEGEKTQLSAQLEAEKASTDSKAREIAARNGANLPQKKAGDRITGGGNDKQMSRADFEALSPSAQRAFCRAGGKPTDQ